jgi:hypothetical protein
MKLRKPCLMITCVCVSTEPGVEQLLRIALHVQEVPAGAQRIRELGATRWSKAHTQK